MSVTFGHRIICLVALVGAACLPASGCDFHVNSNADTDQADGVLTLREALAIANGDHFGGNHIGTCRTLAELNQMPGADYIFVPPPGCPSGAGYTILLPPDIGANCGAGIGDNITFDTNVGSISSTGGYDLGEHDTLDGMQPNGFAVAIVGPGAGSGSGIRFGVGDTTDKWNNFIRNLIITSFGTDGITAGGCQNASLTGLTLANNGRYGLFVDGNRCFTTNIGDVGAGQRNYIYGNVSDGIHIEGIANGDPTSQNNVIRNNWVGLDGVSPLDTTGNGGAGIAVLNSLGNTIGGGGTNQGNAIAKNAGYGLWISGPRSIGNNVLGNLIGSSPDLDLASFPNSRGVQIDGGASANAIGGSGTGEANAIGGNTNHGVFISDAGTNGNSVQYNIIGLNRARTATVANQQDGISISAGAQQTGVHDNVISGNYRWGIFQAGSTTTGTAINNNVIGLRGSANNANDNTIAANGLGGVWFTDSPGNTIGPGNRIDGNHGPGIEISDENADGNTIKGNVIGLDNAGAAAGNTGAGVYIHNGADNTLVGGATAADRNIVSASSGAGIQVSNATTDGTTIRFNFIGTDASGNVARGNSVEGIRIDQATNVAVRQNLVAANANDGIKLHNGASGGYVVLNQVGVANSGLAALPNGASGISLLSGATNNAIGDPITPLLFNIIAGNTGAGIFVADAGTSNNVIVGNIIGSAGFANNYGIYVTANAVGTQITNNAIAQNKLSGVAVIGAGTTGNPIRDNQISGNGGLGIDLGGDGVTANDSSDADGGPNHLQNFPVLYNVTFGASSVTFSATLTSTPSTSFELAFFRSDRCDASGHGEGQTQLGKVNVNSDSSGTATATGLTYPIPNSQTQPSILTATATSASGDTSEFSVCIGVSDQIFGDGFGP